MEVNAWRDFKDGIWQDKIDVRDFIQSAPLFLVKHPYIFFHK